MLPIRTSKVICRKGGRHRSAIPKGARMFMSLRAWLLQRPNKPLLNFRRAVAAGGMTLALLSAPGCGNAFQDNGTHLAYALEKAAGQLRSSPDAELIVRYETLDKPDDPYYIEITPSVAPGQASSTWGSYLVVSGKTSGGTSYHNRFVFVPQRLYLKKELGGSAELILRKDSDRISVVEVR